MRIFLGALAAVFVFSGVAFAAETEGLIKSIDKENSTITLDDGKSYKLPGEFDASSLKEGMDIVLAYDKVEGQNLITDMQLPDGE
ncbi:MAG: DUF1344 domain-containing protein [Rhizobiales bacterium]|nr:DUF1344 domain-containing protein [Hyphomicrobiales bacterium]